MLRVQSTNEKAVENLLTKAEGQTRLNVHGDGNDQRKCAFLLFTVKYYFLSKGLVW